MSTPGAAAAQVSVIIPAHNEAATIAEVVTAARQAQCRPVEVLVVDSLCTDDTVAVATAAGAQVLAASTRIGGRTAEPGKGVALWRGVAQARGEILVFLDADVRSIRSDWVDALVQVLVADPAAQLVKGAYERVHAGVPGEGGRVTEILARPLLRATRPEIAARLSQPLGGEYALRRDSVRQVGFSPGYGVDVGLVVDMAQRWGPQALREVALGQRVHRNRPLGELGRMSEEILRAALPRLGLGPMDPEELPALAALGGEALS